MFDPDKPIKNVGADALHRADFSKSLAEAILGYQIVDSLVIGLYGKWGSGKTSIINMSIEFLKELSLDKEEIEKPIIIKFNPWNFSDQNQLISQFFRQMASAIDKKDAAGRAKSLGTLLENYAKLFEPLSWFYDGGLTAKLASFGMVWIGNMMKNSAQKRSGDLETQKKEISELLKKLNRKIVVVIDDIDRLNNSEIRQIFQLVKVLGDFPNTIYWLAFDKDVVISALDKVQEGEGLDYLEKIVQVPFEIPAISSQEIMKMLFKKLDEIIVGFDVKQWDQVYWGNIFHSGYKEFFHTLRDVHRYMNSLRFSVGLTKQQVNIVDLAAITALQVFETDVYAAIRDNRQLFAGTYESSGYGNTTQEKEKLKQLCDETIERTKTISLIKMRELLERMFPKLSAFYSNTYYGYSSLGDWRKNGRICSPDVFDVYFRLNIPHDEIANSEMRAILSQASSEDGFRALITNLNAEGRIIRFLELLEDYTDADIPSENIPVVISILFDLGDLFPDRESSYSSFGAGMGIMRVTHQLLKRFDNPDARFNLLKACIEKAEKSLYAVVDEVYMQDQQHGRIGTKENNIEEYTVTGEQLDQLEKIALSKIKKWAASGKLIQHPQLKMALFAWKLWEGTDGVFQYITESIKEDNNLLCLLTANLYPIKRQSMSDYIGSSEWRIDLQGIKSFVDLQQIENRVRNILASNDFAQLNSKEQIAVKTFIDTCDGKIKNPY